MLQQILITLGLRFADTARERAFAADFARSMLPVQRTIILIGMAAILIFTVRDFQIAHDVGPSALFFRLFVLLPGLAAMYALTHTGLAVRRHQLLFTAAAVFVVACIFMLAYLNARAEALNPNTPLFAYSGMTHMIVILAVTCGAGLRFPAAAPVGLLPIGTWVTNVSLAGLSLIEMVPTLMHMVALYGFALGLAYWLERSLRAQFAAREQAAGDRARTEALLHAALPPPVAARLQAGERPIADAHIEAAVLFADLTGFTELSKRMGPRQTVRVLDQVFSAFDDICARHRLQAVKTMGDGYMAVGGTFEGAGGPADAAAAALAMQDAVADAARSFDLPLAVRIGLHLGPVIGGVVGRTRPAHDYWGDTVNVASRLESAAQPGSVLCSEALFWRLSPHFVFEAHGTLDLRGFGTIKVYRLQHEAARSDPKVVPLSQAKDARVL